MALQIRRVDVVVVVAAAAAAAAVVVVVVVVVVAFGRLILHLDVHQLRASIGPIILPAN